MSRNFTTDVDTQREYFNATYFNNSGQNQIAKYDTTLLKPFFPNPDQWKLAINRMRVPLSAIPLTRNNIPFQQWEVGIQYSKSISGPTTTDTTFVPQINQKTVTEQTEYVITPNNISLYNTQLTTQIDTTQIQQTIGYQTTNSMFFDYDNLFGGTLYLTNFSVATALSISCISLTTGDILQTIYVPNYYITSLGVDKSTGDLYIGTSEQASPYNMVVQCFPRLSASSWNTIASTLYTLTTQGQPYVLYSVCFCNNYIYTCYWDTQNQSQIVIFQKGTTTQTTQIPTTINNYIQIKNNNNNLLLLYPSVNIVTFNTAVGGTITEIGRVTYDSSVQLSNQIPYFGLDNNGNTLLNLSNQIYAYNSIGVFQYVKTPINFTMMMFAGSNITHTIDSGPEDIFTYQTFLNQINDAFDTSFKQLKNTLGATFLPTEAPSIIYNAQTKLFNLIVEGQYLTENADGSNQYTIFMNDALWQKFLFPSNQFQSIYKSILLQNYGINAVVGTGSATLPQFIYVQQEDSTIYAFYDLVRIIVGTTLIPVSGDGEGKTFSNNGFTSNSAINMITDIVPDTTTLTPGSVIIYIPAGILRWYNLYAQQPFQRVDLILFYETKDGSIYPINIVNGEFFSVKLEFKKGPGDF